MAHVAKHHAEEERERGNRQHGRISLKVLGYTVRVDDQLVDPSELICLNICRWRNCVLLVR